MSSFGSPGGAVYTGKPIPPQRGSFPLDHDGECKEVMSNYLECIKKAKGMNDPSCRELAKGYLSCRMDNFRDPEDRFTDGPGPRSRNLMAKDEFKNLGFAEPKPKTPITTKEPEKGVKGELLW
ncbi:hypothetical protein PG997_003175 [Apiospora hydei]|uniref:Cytochrome c oxidase assembly protein COX19 n=1 Tax=Apiospora hydei TaxID=1337664 RepID=A0ABR1WYJ7_9PEZI